MKRRNSRKSSRKSSRNKSSRKSFRKLSRKKSSRKSRKSTNRRSVGPTIQRVEVFVFGPDTDRYQIQPTTAPTVTKLNLCEQKGFYSCQMSPMCNWNGTQTNGTCR